jgi:hypothetical protein
VAKLTVYAVDWSPEKTPLLGEGVSRAATKLGIDPVKPITLLGVAALGEPRFTGRGRGHRRHRLTLRDCNEAPAQEVAARSSALRRTQNS